MFGLYEQYKNQWKDKIMYCKNVILSLWIKYVKTEKYAVGISEFEKMSHLGFFSTNHLNGIHNNQIIKKKSIFL